MIIKNNEKATLLNYKHDTSNFRWKIYLNKNDKNDDVIIAIMSFNWNTKKRLKDVEVTLTYYKELKNLIIIVEKLIKCCEIFDNACDEIYKVYFDN